MQVQLVNVTTSDGVRLDGYLRIPSVKAEWGLDLVICHHGVGANFYGPSFFDEMGDALLERGCAVLRVNNRGHDQAFQVGEVRLGAAYEIVDDCRRDIVAWLEFAEARGFRRIGLWGHSLGAVKTVYFLSVVPDPRIVCAIASSPPRFSYSAYAASSERFVADVARATSLVTGGQPLELMEAEVPVVRPFSAATYVDKYGPSAQYDYFAHLPQVQVPLLLTLGGLEVENVSFSPLAVEGPGFEARWPRVRYALVEGADHSYTDRRRELWGVAGEWMEEVTAPFSLAR